MPFIAKTALDEELAPLADYPCPADVDVPVTDISAWKAFPHHRWVYLKPLICEVQGIDYGIDSVPPDRFPVFLRPITNLSGYGTGSRKISSRFDFEHQKEPGTFWMPYLEGAHWSVDLIWDGHGVLWHCGARGEKRDDLSFVRWLVEPVSTKVYMAAFEWAQRNLASYRGQLNIELIGNTIIEVHLRLGFQFLPFWGDKFLDSLIEFHRSGRFDFPGITKEGISVPCWDEDRQQHGFENKILEPAKERVGR